MKSFTQVCALLVSLTKAVYPEAENIGLSGTGRDQAQTYHMAGSKADSMSLRLNLYDKDVGEFGNEFHGDITLSMAGA